MKDTKILIDSGVDLDSSLKLLGDMNLYNSTLNDFLYLIKDKMKELNQYKESSDMTSYSTLVNSIKKDAEYLGFKSLFDKAESLEIKSKCGDVQGVNSLHNLLISELNKMISISNMYINNKQVEKISTTSDVMDEVLSKRVDIKKETNQINNSKKDGIILVVDDSNLVANFVKKIFDNKYEVVIANDGIKAINIVSNEEIRSKIKACLLDLNMPNVSGFDVLENFKKNNYFVKLPVAIISGIENRELLDKANSYPIVDILSKPFNERDVERVVEKCLATYF